MITTNYSANNQPAFGRFRFSNGAKKLIKKRTETPEMLKELNNIISSEAKRTDRNIDISRVFSKLVARINGGKRIVQRTYNISIDKDAAFLEEMKDLANAIESEKQFNKHVSDVLDKLMK